MKIPGTETLPGAHGVDRGGWKAMTIEVESYSGYRADERPLRFVLNGRGYEVAEVEDRWYSPQATYFRVLASDGNRYVLCHDEKNDIWSLEAFRAARE